MLQRYDLARMGLLVLSDSQVRSLIKFDVLFDAIEDALRAIARRTSSAPGRTAVMTATGGLYSMPGFVPGYGLATKLICNFPDNPKHGLPTHHGLVALFDDRTGEPLSVMNASYLTAIRTAATSAVATRLLSRADSNSLAIIGAGLQAAAHLEAVTRVRTFKDIRIASRNFEHARRLASGLEHARALNSFEEAICGADVICGCLDTREPAILGRWLGPSTHVNSVGGFFGAEIDEATVKGSAVYVESPDALQPPPVGSNELQHLSLSEVTLLGSLLETTDGQLVQRRPTLYKSTGHAAEDVVVARHVYDNALAAGLGVNLDF